MSPAPTSERHTAAGRFFRNPETGKPAVVQAPNLPLSVWLAATLARLVFAHHGWVGTALSAVGTLSLAVWAVLEVARGDSPFRRVLGALVLAGLLASLLIR
ncbi:MAG: hypothetical protein M3N21_03335 [Actinomycetota bacterium]|nr:hypothetical protein [Actinomycetota bacterium]